MKTITHADGSFSIDAGDGYVFGPYGPGECEAVHTTGMKCKSYKGHGGCHATFDYDTPAGKMKHRWTDKRST